jgi:hypothetical protein
MATVTKNKCGWRCGDYDTLVGDDGEQARVQIIELGNGWIRVRIEEEGHPQDGAVITIGVLQ